MARRVTCDFTSQITESYLAFALDRFLPLNELQEQWVRYRYGNLCYYEGIIAYNRKCPHYTDFLFTGSRYEELSVLEHDSPSSFTYADADFMGILKNPANYHIDLIDTDVHAGYLRPYILQGERKVHLLLSEFQISKSTNVFSSEIFTQLQKAAGSDNITGYKEETHGPSLQYRSQAACASPYKSDTDLDRLHALPHRHWPLSALEWTVRNRPGNWPSKEIIRTIQQQGCHIVPTPHPNSLRPDIEWRYSFSAAELKLAHELSDVQKQCYILLKVLCKYALGNSSELKSYCLKMVFFRCCERIPARLWTSENLGFCFCYVLDQLLACLTCRNIPHYFIISNNLIDHIPEFSIQKDIQKLVRLRKAPVDVIVQWHTANKSRYSISPFLQEHIHQEIRKNDQQILRSVHQDGTRHDLTTAMSKIVDAYLFSGRPWMAIEALADRPMTFGADPLIHCIKRMEEMMTARRSLMTNDTTVMVYISLAQLYSLYTFTRCTQRERNEMVDRVKKTFGNALTLLPRGTLRTSVVMALASFLYKSEQYNDMMNTIASFLADATSRNDIYAVSRFHKCMVNILDENLQKEMMNRMVIIEIPCTLYGMYLQILAAKKLARQDLPKLLDDFRSQCENWRNVGYGYCLLGYAYFEVHDYLNAVNAFSHAYVRCSEIPFFSENLVLALLLLVLRFIFSGNLQFLSHKMKRMFRMYTAKLLLVYESQVFRIRKFTELHTTRDVKAIALSWFSFYGQKSENMSQIMGVLCDFAFICAGAASGSQGFSNFLALKVMTRSLYKSAVEAHGFPKNVIVLTEYSNFLTNEGFYEEALENIHTVLDNSSLFFGSPSAIRHDVHLLDEKLQKDVLQGGPFVLSCKEYCYYLMVKIFLRTNQKDRAVVAAWSLNDLCKVRPALYSDAHILVGDVQQMMKDACSDVAAPASSVGMEKPVCRGPEKELKYETARNISIGGETLNRPDERRMNETISNNRSGGVMTDEPLLPHALPWKFLLLGYAFMELEDFVSAQTAFLQALELDPDRTTILQNIQICAQKIQDGGSFCA